MNVIKSEQSAMTVNTAETCPLLDQKDFKEAVAFGLTVLLNLVQQANISEV